MVPPTDSSILVIDPDPATRNCIQECIDSSFGNRTHVVTATTTQEGYRQLDQWRPHLIVIETDLPDGEGSGIIRHAREISPSTTIIVCSHLRGVRDKVAAFEAGADDYVVKPLSAERMALRFQLLGRFLELVASGRGTTPPGGPPRLG